MYMALLHKIATMRGLPSQTLGLFVTAIFISAAVRFTLLFLKFSRVLKWLGSANKESPEDITASQEQYLHKVKTALWLCNKYTPWNTECYVQAVTAKILLRRKCIPATVYIGFKKQASGKMTGHAWLRCGRLIVTGNKGHEAFQVHSYFS
jgi:hypothetical protein